MGFETTIPNGISNDIVPIVPSDTDNNVPNDNIGFIAYFKDGANTRGTLSALTWEGGDTPVTIPFVSHAERFIKVKRIMATGLDSNVEVVAMVAR